MNSAPFAHEKCPMCHRCTTSHSSMASAATSSCSRGSKCSCGGGRCVTFNKNAENEPRFPCPGKVCSRTKSPNPKEQINEVTKRVCKPFAAQPIPETEEKEFIDEKEITEEQYKTINDHDYVRFSLHITEDILRGSMFSDEEMDSVFASHIAANRGHLDMGKMLEQIDYLRKEVTAQKPVKSQASFPRQCLEWCPMSSTFLYKDCLNTQCKLKHESTAPCSNSEQQKPVEMQEMQGMETIKVSRTKLQDAESKEVGHPSTDENIKSKQGSMSDVRLRRLRPSSVESISSLKKKFLSSHKENGEFCMVHGPIIIPKNLVKRDDICIYVDDGRDSAHKSKSFTVENQKNKKDLPQMTGTNEGELDADETFDCKKCLNTECIPNRVSVACNQRASQQIGNKEDFSQMKGRNKEELDQDDTFDCKMCLNTQCIPNRVNVACNQRASQQIENKEDLPQMMGRNKEELEQDDTSICKKCLQVQCSPKPVNVVCNQRASQQIKNEEDLSQMSGSNEGEFDEDDTFDCKKCSNTQCIPNQRALQQIEYKEDFPQMKGRNIEKVEQDDTFDCKMCLNTQCIPIRVNVACNQRASQQIENKEDLPQMMGRNKEELEQDDTSICKKCLQVQCSPKPVNVVCNQRASQQIKNEEDLSQMSGSNEGEFDEDDTFDCKKCSNTQCIPNQRASQQIEYKEDFPQMKGRNIEKVEQDDTFDCKMCLNTQCIPIRVNVACNQRASQQIENEEDLSQMSGSNEGELDEDDTFDCKKCSNTQCIPNQRALQQVENEEDLSQMSGSNEGELNEDDTFDSKKCSNTQCIPIRVSVACNQRVSQQIKNKEDLPQMTGRNKEELDQNDTFDCKMCSNIQCIPNRVNVACNKRASQQFENKEDLPQMMGRNKEELDQNDTFDSKKCLNTQCIPIRVSVACNQRASQQIENKEDLPQMTGRNKEELDQNDTFDCKMCSNTQCIPNRVNVVCNKRASQQFENKEDLPQMMGKNKEELEQDDTSICKKCLQVQCTPKPVKVVCNQRALQQIENKEDLPQMTGRNKKKLEQDDMFDCKMCSNTQCIPSRSNVACNKRASQQIENKEDLPQIPRRSKEKLEQDDTSVCKKGLNIQCIPYRVNVVCNQRASHQIENKEDLPQIPIRSKEKLEQDDTSVCKKCLNTQCIPNQVNVACNQRASHQIENKEDLPQIPRRSKEKLEQDDTSVCKKCLNTQCIPNQVNVVCNQRASHQIENKEDLPQMPRRSKEKLEQDDMSVCKKCLNTQCIPNQVNVACNQRASHQIENKEDLPQMPRRSKEKLEQDDMSVCKKCLNTQCIPNQVNVACNQRASHQIENKEDLPQMPKRSKEKLEQDDTSVCKKCLNTQCTPNRVNVACNQRASHQIENKEDLPQMRKMSKEKLQQDDTIVCKKCLQVQCSPNPVNVVCNNRGAQQVQNKKNLPQLTGTNVEELGQDDTTVCKKCLNLQCIPNRVNVVCNQIAAPCSISEHNQEQEKHRKISKTKLQDNQSKEVEHRPMDENIKSEQGPMTDVQLRKLHPSSVETISSSKKMFLSSQKETDEFCMVKGPILIPKKLMKRDDISIYVDNGRDAGHKSGLFTVENQLVDNEDHLQDNTFVCNECSITQCRPRTEIVVCNEKAGPCAIIAHNKEQEKHKKIQDIRVSQTEFQNNRSKVGPTEENIKSKQGPKTDLQLRRLHPSSVETISSLEKKFLPGSHKDTGEFCKVNGPIFMPKNVIKRDDICIYVDDVKITGHKSELFTVQNQQDEIDEDLLQKPNEEETSQNVSSKVFFESKLNKSTQSGPRISADNEKMEQSVSFDQIDECNRCQCAGKDLTKVLKLQIKEDDAGETYVLINGPLYIPKNLADAKMTQFPPNTFASKLTPTVIQHSATDYASVIKLYQPKPVEVRKNYMRRSISDEMLPGIKRFEEEMTENRKIQEEIDAELAKYELPIDESQLGDNRYHFLSRDASTNVDDKNQNRRQNSNLTPQSSSLRSTSSKTPTRITEPDERFETVSTMAVALSRPPNTPKTADETIAEEELDPNPKVIISATSDTAEYTRPKTTSFQVDSFEERFKDFEVISELNASILSGSDTDLDEVTPAGVSKRLDEFLDQDKVNMAKKLKRDAGSDQKKESKMHIDSLENLPVGKIGRSLSKEDWSEVKGSAEVILKQLDVKPTDLLEDEEALDNIKVTMKDFRQINNTTGKFNLYNVDDYELPSPAESETNRINKYGMPKKEKKRGCCDLRKENDQEGGSKQNKKWCFKCRQ